MSSYLLSPLLRKVILFRVSKFSRQVGITGENILKASMGRDESAVSVSPVGAHRPRAAPKVEIGLKQGSHPF